MNKKKIAILALLMIAVIMLTSCLMAACNPNGSNSEEAPKIEATEGLLINNGDFKVIDTGVKTYPRAVTSWTGAKMYSSSSFRDDVTAGVISLERDLYYANKSKWKDGGNELYDKLNAGGRYDGDADEIKNALMVYMPKEDKDADGNKIYGPTAYGYTSASFSLDKSSYYKLSVDVLTYDIGGNGTIEDGSKPGARIYVSSNTYAEFEAIDTKGEWKTYELFIETSASSTSLTLLLGLGKYNSYYSKGLTTGYAFFDNVSLEKIDTDPESDAKVTVAGTEVESYKAFDAATAKEIENNAQIATTTLKVPNGRFDFGSTNLSSSTAPSSWSLVTGNSGKDDPAPTSLGHNAIIDVTQLAEKLGEWADSSSTNKIMYNLRDSESLNTNRPYYPTNDLKNNDNLINSIKALPQGTVGSNVYMLSQQLMTAQGIRSSRTITIEKNNLYAISINLFTYDIHGAGVSLILTGSDGKDIIIKGISSQPSQNYYIGKYQITPGTGSGSSLAGNEDNGASTGGWTAYTFYIKGNQFRDFSYNMAIWLGTDGTTDNTSSPYYSYTSSSNSTTYSANGTFSNGWVFIDDLTLTKLDSVDLTSYADNIKDVTGADKYELDCSAEGGYTGLFVDLHSDNLFGDGDNYILSQAKATGEPVPSLKDVVSKGDTFGAPAGWDSSFKTTATSPSIEGAITEGIVSLDENGYNGVEGTYPGVPYEPLDSLTAYMMHSSKQSYYEVETAPFTVKANQFYRISLWIKTVDVSSTSGAYVYLLDKSDEDNDATLTSFTKINTKDYDEQTHDWCEVTIAVRGSNGKDTEVALKFTLGTGNRWAASTLTGGALFVTNMSMSEITYSNFKNTTTGTYVKSVDMSESYAYTFTNGSFDNYDLDDEKLESGTALANQTVAATPDDWTVNDKTIGINGDKVDENGIKDDKNGTPTSLFAGVVALNKDDDDKLNFLTSDQLAAVTGLDASAFTDFYNKSKNPDLSEEYLDTVAGPNMLAIGSKDSDKKYALGFASASVTLSANTYYQLSVYAKTLGDTTASIFLTGESSASTGTNYFLIHENNTKGDWTKGDWTKYTFFIEVGNTSVSIKLNLWLGRNVNYMDVEGDTDEAKANNAKSAGAVFFDNVVYKTIDNDTYNKADGENDKKISFLTDSFDSLSDDAESRTKLTAPSGWTGSVESGLSTSNTKGGIVYADSHYYTTENVDGTEYSRLLGLEYSEDDIEITEEDIADAKNKPEFEDKTDDEIVAALKAQKLVEQKKNNWIPVSELQAMSGRRMLVINNTKASAYTYTGSSNTLKANSFYEISVYVKTFGLNADPDYKGKDEDTTIGATVELYLGSANQTGEPLIFKKIATQKTDGDGNVISNDYVKYTFYVKTQGDDVTSVTLKLSLGSSVTEDIDGVSVTSGLTSGYAMFDDASFKKRDDLDDTKFARLETDLKDDETALVHTVANDEQGNSEPTNPGINETPKGSFNLEYLWWMIPTIVIGLVIIAVVVVLIIRKLRKNGTKKAVKIESAPANTEMLDKKRSRYDDNKE